MRTFEIQDGRTLRKQSVHHRTVYPFHKMEVGQSFLVQLEDDPRGNKVRSAAYAYASRHEGYRFQVGPDDGGYLVLRVECRPGREKRQPAVEVPDRPQATVPVAPVRLNAACWLDESTVEERAAVLAKQSVGPLPPHTVMIGGELHPDPARPWAGKRLAEFTVEERMAIVQMHIRDGVSYNLLNDEEIVVIEEWANGHLDEGGLAGDTKQEVTATGEEATV